ncbi:MAG: site-specific DNA-methyltransferase [Thaumarchaeota archaeon]|nr:site-specific DNA-methyltransferase [Nitrososphaerota archaeon]
MKLNTIHNADCRDVLPTIPDESIDLILTDPPYLTTNLKFDKNKLPDNIYSELKRILKPNGWFFCFGTFEMFVEIHNAGFKRKFEYIWVKPMGLPAMQSKRPTPKHEIITAFLKSDLKSMKDVYFDKEAIKTKGIREKRYYNSVKVTGFKKEDPRGLIRKERVFKDDHGMKNPTSVLYANNKGSMKKSERTSHPTQKPLSILKTIAKGYCPKDGVVLDPFVGSGSTCLAAKTENRQYIGIEKDSEYYKICQSRLQGTL